MMRDKITTIIILVVLAGIIFGVQNIINKNNSITESRNVNYPSEQRPIEILTVNEETKKEFPNCRIDLYAANLLAGSWGILQHRYNSSSGGTNLKENYLLRGEGLYLDLGANPRIVSLNNLMEKKLVGVDGCGVEIMNVLNSKDRTILIFSIFKHGNLSDGNELATSIYIYYLYPHEEKLLKVPEDTDQGSFIEQIGDQYRILFAQGITDNNRYLNMEALDCWGCEGSLWFPTVLYDLENKKLKNLGAVSAFRWLEDGGFEYKPPVPEDLTCKSGGDEECGPRQKKYIDQQPWLSGGWN